MTSDMNTPEHITDSDHISENNRQYINQFQTQFVQNSIPRIQGRDYGRILRKYNTPAQWYKPSSVTRSVYYYDPHYQRYLQQQTKPSPNVRLLPLPTRSTNQSKSRSTKHTTDSHNHQQKATLPSRLQSIPTLPPIITHKKLNHE